MATIFRFTQKHLNKNLTHTYEYKDENGKIITRRFVEGDSELDMKKQSPNAVPKKFSVTALHMEIDNPALVEFLKGRRDFGTDITIYDPAEENKKALEAINNSRNVFNTVFDMDNTSILQLGILVKGQPALKSVVNNDYNGLRKDMLAYTSQHPEKVSKLIDDNENKDYLWAAMAFAKRIVKADESDTAVKWVDNDTLVTRVTKGTTPVEALVDFFSTQDGAEVKQEIGLRMQKKATEQIMSKASDYPDSLEGLKNLAKENPEIPEEEYIKATSKKAVIEVLEKYKK